MWSYKLGLPRLYLSKVKNRRAAIKVNKILPVGEHGCARIERYDIPDSFAAWKYGASPGKDFTRLYVDGNLMMSDTDMENETNYEIMNKANGDVLIAGLGIGLILLPLFESKDVRSLTVIEKFQDVIDLVHPAYKNKKLKVICADIFEWRPSKGVVYDTIYFDIWPNICTDNLIQIQRLHNAFKFKLNRKNPRAWMDSWFREGLQYMKRTGRRPY